MNIKKEDIEIMAPVGSFESLMAAIQGGANSIYFGIEQLNMRSKSSNNFTTKDLVEIVAICNKHKVKTYLTVNTIIYDHNIELMKKIVDAAKENGVSAIIASDFAVINYAYSVGVEIHASTQLNISNIEAVRFFARFCDVIVTARELSLRQVKNITQSIEDENICGPSGKKVRVEVFAHGALCMAVSGKCYLSLHEQNSSANRRACRQTCRKAYIVTEKESGNELEIDNEYIMSPKDLCTVGFIDKIIEAGITVLKIEGRARAPEYVNTVSKVYRNAVDEYIDGNYSMTKIKDWEEQLATVFNRGFWDGYYLGRKLGEWSTQYGSQATTRKIYIGKGMNYFSKINVAEFLIEAGELNIGDKILITGPTTGVVEFELKEMRVDLKPTECAKKGTRVSIPVAGKIRASDKLYKVVKATNEFLQ